MDPLSQLKDIHLPEPIHNYPLALGWWLLAFIIVVLLIVSMRQLLKRRAFNHAKKQALGYLSSDELNQQELLAIIKWACLQYYPRHQVAPLYGEAFANFLIKQLPEKQQNAPWITPLSDAITNQYQLTDNKTSDVDTCELKNACSQWLTLALTSKRVAATTHSTLTEQVGTDAAINPEANL